MLAPSTDVPIDYDITNNRDKAIAVAELIPDATYDAETQTVTVTLGSEVPGEQFLPRLVLIKPGEQKTFSSRAHVSLPISEMVETPTRSIATRMRCGIRAQLPRRRGAVREADRHQRAGRPRPGPRGRALPEMGRAERERHHEHPADALGRYAGHEQWRRSDRTAAKRRRP